MPISILIALALGASRSRRNVYSPVVSEERTSASSSCLSNFKNSIYWILTRFIRRLSDLQQETNDLRRRLKSSQSSTNPHPSPISMLTAAAELGASPANSEPTTLQMSPISPYPQPMLSRVCSSPEEPRAELASSGEQAADITLTRTLNGVEVTGFEIDEIFQLCV